MRDLVTHIVSENAVAFKESMKQRLTELVNEKINQVKMRVANDMYEGISLDVDFVEEELYEGNIQKMGRTKLIRVRIRGGKVQRRKKLSSVKGYTIRGGKMIRMSPQERRNRKMASRRSKFKRRAKLRQSLRKRKISLRRRKAMGL
jgi:hypothetical protein